MSKVVKGVARGIRGIGRGLKKGFKKIVSSKLGKAVLIAVAIYFGGAALGAWNSAVPAVNGAWTAAGSQAAQTAAVGGATSSAATAAGGSALAPGAGVLASGNGGLALAAPTAGQTIASSVIPEALGGATSTAAATAAPAVASAAPLMAPGGVGSAAEGVQRPGILERLVGGAKTVLGKTAGYADAHPYATAMMVNAAASALSPDEMDLQERAYDREDEIRQRQIANLNVGSIKTNIQPSKTTLRTSDGTNVFQNGFLNTTLPRS